MIITDNNIASMPPSLPTELPPSLQHILSAAPLKAREAIAMGVFSPLRCLMSDVELHYCDGSTKEPSLCSILVAEQGSGKSSIEPVIEAILEPIAERDRASRKLEAEWREQVKSLGSNKRKPSAPNGVIQRIYPNTTMAALIKRAHNAGNLSLYMYAPEAELLFNQLPECSAVLRCSYDATKFGSERASAQGISDEVRIRLTINCRTQPSTARFLLRKELSNGLLSRASISTIWSPQDDWGEEMPRQQGQYDEEYRQGLKPYLDRLMQAKGVIRCLEAEQWLLETKKAKIQELRDMDAKYFLPYLWRSLQQSFYRASILYIMEGYQWSQPIEDFVSFSCDYDIWCKFHFFGDLIENACNNTMPDNSKRQANLLSLLPDEFTRDQARTMRSDMGRSTTEKALSGMLAQWKFRGLITHDTERQLYVKTDTNNTLAKAIPHTRAPAE